MFILQCSLKIMYPVPGLDLKFIYHSFAISCKLNYQVLFTRRVPAYMHNTIHFPTIHTADYISFYPYNLMYTKGGKNVLIFIKLRLLFLQVIDSVQ